jgi:hypothetical protein
VGLYLSIKVVEPLRDNLGGFIIRVGNSDELALESNLLEGFYLAYINCREELNKVFVRHPESSIILIELWLQELLYIWCPESTTSAPCTVPFEVSP